MRSPGSRPGFVWDPRARARGLYEIPGLAPGVCMGSSGSRPGFVWDARDAHRNPWREPGDGALERRDVVPTESAGRGRGCLCYLDGVGNRSAGRMPEGGQSPPRGQSPASVRRDGTGDWLYARRAIHGPGGLRGPPAAGRTSGRPCSARVAVWTVNPQVSGIRVAGGVACAISTALETEAQAGCRSEVSIERAGGRMPEASVRRDGTGNPDQRKGQPQLAGGIQSRRYRGQLQLAGGSSVTA